MCRIWFFVHYSIDSKNYFFSESGTSSTTLSWNKDGKIVIVLKA